MKNVYYKRPVEGHQFLRDNILKAIDASPNIYNMTSTESHITDYKVDVSVPRLYDTIVMPAIMSHMRAVEQVYKFKGINLISFWFQKYNTGDFHDWHVHPSCHFTNVYFVELPDTTLVTQVKNPFDDNNIIDITVNEGDILTFPGFFYHQAPVVSNGVKTIISFNTNIL
jgi:hypothetical protein